jgi:5-methyltetrahydrofolate--homocysteine methyltransferase
MREEVKIMVGGAPVTQEFADEMGADAYGANAIDCVQKAKDFSTTKNGT